MINICHEIHNQSIRKSEINSQGIPKETRKVLRNLKRTTDDIAGTDDLKYGPSMQMVAFYFFIHTFIHV
jgi:hypothetical protein